MKQPPVDTRFPRGGGARRPARLATLAIATIAAFGLSGLSAVPAYAEPTTINLVTVNDFHGRIERDGAAAGAAALATAVKQIRTANPNTVFAAAGDLIGASTFTSFIQQDVPTIDALNAAGLDVSAAGNHEFDQGWADLRDRVQGLANWEYISSNVFMEGTSETALSESWTTTLPNGVTMGFVGAVTEELPSLVSPAGIADLDVRDIVTSVNAAADRLSDGIASNGEADIVVLLVHEGAADTSIDSATDRASAFGRIVLGVDKDVDAIVSGHTHLAYNHVIDGRPVISSGQYGEKFSNLTITYDPATKAVAMSNQILDAKPYADDPIVASIVSAAQSASNTLGAVELGTVTADFNRALQPGRVNGQPALVENRGGESTLGNFVADVQLWAVRQDSHADIAFMNPGGLRANIGYAPDGLVTYKEAANVQPFANTLMTLTLTGAQVKQVLEQQWQPAGASRPFLKLGVNKELTYTYDPAAPAGSHVSHVYLNGVEIDAQQEYRVVANSFLAAGGDSFTILAQGASKSDTGKVDLQSMVDWLAANRTASPDYAQRAVGVHLVTPNAVGEPLSIDLSSLDFSTTETAAGLVTVTLGGFDLGDVAVNRTLLEKYDEVGQAHIQAMLPAGLDGWQDLIVSVPATQTRVAVPVFLKSSTETGLRLNNLRSAKAGSTVILWASVEAPVTAVGTLTVLVDGEQTGVVDYSPNDAGEVKLKLPKSLSEGTHVVTVVFSGNDELLASERSVSVTLK